jgi:putative hydrolase of the HAD superfamily
MGELTLGALKDEIRRGARCILQVRHAERPKMDPHDPSFGDDLHLTREGVRTARLLGESLAEFNGDVAFAASPLTRTRETAALIAEGMGVKDAAIPADPLLGNGSFYYDDPLKVLDLFNTTGFFEACYAYFEKGKMPGLTDLYEATDACEKWLVEHAGTHRLFVATTHDCYIAAFLSARHAHEKFSKKNWPRFLDAAAILTYPDGTRRYALVRAGLSHGICGVRPVRAAVFDFGGVMTKTTMPERVRACAQEFGIPWKCLEDGFAKYRRMTDGGFMTLEEMYDLIWADADLVLSKEVQERILAEDRASFLEGYINWRTLDWMRELKAKGYKIGILTNMPPKFAIDFRRVFKDFIALADAMVISGDEKMFKPQHRIYDLLMKRIGLHADELCFFDDVEENCEAARRAGWNAIRFESNEQVERDFAARY